MLPGKCAVAINVKTSVLKTTAILVSSDPSNALTAAFKPSPWVGLAVEVDRAFEPGSEGRCRRRSWRIRWICSFRWRETSSSCDRVVGCERSDPEPAHGSGLWPCRRWSRDSPLSACVRPCPCRLPARPTRFATPSPNLDLAFPSSEIVAAPRLAAPRQREAATGVTACNSRC